ncbi:salivary selenoprotein precursor-like protein [Dermatophagoides farinae]|uniref:Selenoprotein F n=1 Tax=Dermatophagoides farinae TaxID=6954 RepID=A0A9D4SG96_DERFA|nr:salivary selenoprotein precursor-like protein [Dermatophagoides farinae]
MNPMYLFGCFMSVIITSIVGEKLTDNECNQLGYNPAELFCSRCLELTKFELDNLKDSSFIRGDKSKKYSNLKIKFVRGILPILKLLNEHHDVVDELNIQKWDTDTIEEFLDQHLLS